MFLENHSVAIKAMVVAEVAHIEEIGAAANQGAATEKVAHHVSKKTIINSLHKLPILCYNILQN